MIGDWWNQFKFQDEELAKKMLADSTFQKVIEQCAILWVMMSEEKTWMMALAMIGAAYMKGIETGETRATAGELFPFGVEVVKEKGGDDGG